MIGFRSYQSFTTILLQLKYLVINNLLAVNNLSAICSRVLA